MVIALVQTNMPVLIHNISFTCRLLSHRQHPHFFQQLTRRRMHEAKSHSTHWSIEQMCVRWMQKTRTSHATFCVLTKLVENVIRCCVPTTTIQSWLCTCHVSNNVFILFALNVHVFELDRRKKKESQKPFLKFRKTPLTITDTAQLSPKIL